MGAWRSQPDRVAGVDAEAFYRAVNRVAPSPIRIEADELTYTMHIVLRFELEIALVEGRLNVDELPAALAQLGARRVREVVGTLAAGR